MKTASQKSINVGSRVRVRYGPCANRTGRIVDYLVNDCTEWCIKFDDTGAETWGGFVSSQLERVETPRTAKANDGDHDGSGCLGPSWS